MASIFTRIIAGEIPSYKIAENDRFLAFLDVFPIVRGHVLVVPKQEVDRFFDLNDTLLSEYLVFAKPIALAIEKAIPCKRVGMSVIGLEVPHAHLHLVPMQSADDVNFTRPKLSLSPDEMKEIQAAIMLHLA
ncbi:MAG: HIT family protein [Chitinophagaceae bacterium]